MESINTYEIYEQSITHDYTMIKATATWCGPCHKVQPQVLELVEDEKYKDIHFYEYDIDEIDDCPLQECIRVVPTFLFFEKDKLVHTIKGTDIKSVTNYLNTFVKETNNLKISNLEDLQKLKLIKSKTNQSEDEDEDEQEEDEKKTSSEKS
jgi:thiol-disulfide isomerase/thioredoxin